MLSILTTAHTVVKMDNMNATLLISEKSVDAQGGTLQIVIWKVPQLVSPTMHGFKYRLVYARDGRRIVGFDNERGKGDHMHLGDKELPYQFHSVAQLLEDFAVEVEKWRA
jgi:hypothetical protein